MEAQAQYDQVGLTSANGKGSKSAGSRGHDDDNRVSAKAMNRQVRQRR